MSFQNDLLELVPSLRAFAYSLCGSHDRADDLVQDALVKAWAKQDSFQPGTHFKAWMFTILRNTYYSQFRRKKREVRDEDGEMSARLAVHPEQHGHADLTDMKIALVKLSDEQREALMLITAEGLSYEEAALICDCAVGTVKSRVNRARARLADLLGVSSASEYGPDGVSGSIISREVTIATT
ncbi:MAG: sigma-70 family RNA polymerase sigma factor [Pseudomonadota bacterium]